jgi:hypothetical protein
MRRRNRSERICQLTYVVRVIPPASSFEQHSQDGDDEDHAGTDGAFMRLRTGRDLVPVMRADLNWRNSSCFDDKVDLDCAVSSFGFEFASHTTL